jgi:hypothetical protein
LLCYHNKVCGGDCITSDERELARLKRTGADIMSACRAAECVRDVGILYWEAFYADCSLHLVGEGEMPSICETGEDIDEVQYLVYVQETMCHLDILHLTGPNANIDVKAEVTKEALQTVCRFMYYQIVLDLTKKGTNATGSLEYAILCILHLHKRVIENVIEMLMRQSLNEADNQSKDGRIALCRKVSKHLNTLAFIIPEDPGPYVVPHDKDGKSGDIKFNDGWAENIELKFPELLSKLLVKRTSKKQKWSDCLTSLTSIFQTLFQKRDFTDTEIDILQKQMASGYTTGLNWTTKMVRRIIRI